MLKISAYDLEKKHVRFANYIGASDDIRRIRYGAGDEIRTHDIYLGKVTLYPWATPATDWFIHGKPWKTNKIMIRFALSKTY